MKKIMMALAMVLVCILAVPAATTNAAAKISKKAVVLYVGDQTKVKVNGTSRRVTWTSSNTKVATVKNGTITAKKQGNAVVTAKVGNQKYTCKVTVKNQQLSKKSVTLKENHYITIKLIGANHKVVWKTSNKKVATVKNGKILAVKAGTATITATSNGKSYACKVTVKAKKVVKKIEKTQVVKIHKDLVKGVDGYLKKLVIKKKSTKGNYVYFTVTQKSYQALQDTLKQELNKQTKALASSDKNIKTVYANGGKGKLNIYTTKTKTTLTKKMQSQMANEAATAIKTLHYYQTFQGKAANQISVKVNFFHLTDSEWIAKLYK